MFRLFPKKCLHKTHFYTLEGRGGKREVTMSAKTDDVIYRWLPKGKTVAMAQQNFYFMRGVSGI